MYEFAAVNGTKLHYHVTGSGPPLVLIHAGITHLEMWAGQIEAFASHFQVIRYDVRGWGKSASPPGTYAHYDDLSGLLKHLDVEQAAILGISHGGKIAIDFTLVYPQMVKALVLVAPALGGYEFIDQATNQKDATIEKAYERGDIALAIELETQLWVDGPQRTPDQVSPEVRARVLKMIDDTYRLPGGEGTPQSLDPPAISRLAEIKAPTQIIIGDYDVPDMLAIADLLAANVSGAQKVVMQGVAHLPCMERPGEFNRLVLDFMVKAGKPAPNIQTVSHFETIAREPGDPRTALTLDQIISMCQRGFGPKVKIDSIRELGGGTFNATYLIKFEDSSKVILRVAPPQTTDTFWDHQALMRREHHLQPFFASLATLMAKTIMTDFTHQVVERDYTFQTFIEGERWDEIEGELTLEENLALWRQFGQVVREIHDTTGESFGWPFPGSQFTAWSEAVLDRFERIIPSMVECQLEAADVITISNMARTHSSLLDEIKQPRLLHGDLWSFNVLVSRDEGEPNIVGILDADRAWWGDPMADWTMFLLSIRRDEPQLQQPQAAFWEGYGGVIKSDKATLFREMVYQGMHLGITALWFAKKGGTGHVQRAYTKLREIVQTLPTLI